MVKGKEITTNRLYDRMVVNERFVWEDVTVEIQPDSPDRDIIKPNYIEVKNITASPMPDKVEIAGELEGEVPYLDDLSPEYLSTSFRKTINLQGVRDYHEIIPLVRVDKIYKQVKDSSVIKLKFYLEIFLQIIRPMDIEIVKEMAEDLGEANRERITYLSQVKSEQKSFQLKCDHLLSYNPKEIKQIDAGIELSQINQENETLILGGKIIGQSAFIAEETGERIKESFTEDFYQEISLPSLKPEMVADVFPRIETIGYSDQKEQKLEINVEISLIISLKNVIEKEVISEVVHTDAEVDFETLNFTIPKTKQISEQVEKRVPLEVAENLQENTDGIDAQIVNLTKEINKDMITIKGQLELVTTKQVDQKTEDNEMQFDFQKDVRFKGMQREDNVYVHPRIEFVILEFNESEHEENNNEVFVQAFINFVIIKIKDYQYQLVTDLEYNQSEEKLKSSNQTTFLKVYVVQKNDTIYEIAHRFGLDPEDITKANDIKNPDMVFEGQKLFIPKS
ncbi:LysM peptidoglycan-binding domain-containing protein [Natranaerobius thermophilus]|uniref:Peptidoglycan-binding LysM n=1 Tax=Natranaerobius thermophilus (strain ATCC BAA-1301 / DSM 18059 / JW/NM-WN-LF) TaxID=457570 RepID=B2A3M3_NATTJ|nr:LysM domain-containing protein [Natranaerobius thermophilus]ACB83649.1 Peptidoglycan-binding LysM [Natranaerobius thermophilus JW/NM-WN-LF]